MEEGGGGGFRRVAVGRWWRGLRGKRGGELGFGSAESKRKRSVTGCGMQAAGWGRGKY